MPGKIPRQPLNLILFKGKTHLTKKEIQERRDQEVIVPVGEVHAPKYLPKELLSEFNKISVKLVEIGIFTDLDVDALCRFLIAREQYIKTMNLLRDTNPEEDGITYYDRILRTNDTLFKQCRVAAQDLGLTISSRCNLLVPKKKREEPSEFDRKFGGV